MTASLAPLRAEIDALDEEIVDLLARRFGVVRRVAVVKAAEGLPAVLPDRVEAVKQRAAALGAARGLAPDFMLQLYQMIIDEACRIEEAHFAATATPPAGPPRS